MTKQLFGTIDGKDVYKYTLSGNGVTVSVINFGAAVQSIVVDGVETVQSFAHAEDYKNRSGYVCGAIGRVANRIADAKFTLDGTTYNVTKNEGDNQLHGGKVGFNHKFFDVEETDDGVTMTYVSADGEEGFPGKLTFTVKFTLVDRTFRIDYSACSDKDTVWAPTHHFYFNLNGQVGGANSNILAIYADGYTPVDEHLIPLGNVLPVDGTPFDFRTAKQVGRDKTERGIYDHNFMLNGNHAATMTGDQSGITMDIYTDMPAMQMYTGAGGEEKRAVSDPTARGGVALEPQFVPNAINMDGFAKPILKSGETQTHYISLTFAQK